MKQINSLLITGRKWFDRVNGNTYFSAVAYVDGLKVATIAYEYGYDNQYLDSMLDLLEKEGLIPSRVRHSNGSKEAPWKWAEINDINLEYTAANVGRKRDL